MLRITTSFRYVKHSLGILHDVGKDRLLLFHHYWPLLRVLPDPLLTLLDASASDI